MTKVIKRSDNINEFDKLVSSASQGATKWKTDIQIGTGLYEDSSGMKHLREVLERTTNEVVIGGSLFALEKMFGVKSNLHISTINTVMGINPDNSDVSNRYLTDNYICLFGVGTEGCGDAINTVKPVKFTDRDMGGMVPFRYTPENLSATDSVKYWFKTTDELGNVSYYLKSFENPCEIKALWDDANEDGEDGSPVTDDVHTTSRTENIFVFAEIILKIDKKDIKEWFEANGEVELARVNSVGLFSGIMTTLEDGSQDYKDVKMMTKFNFNNEMLDMNKDLEFIYRIYTA